VRFPFSDLSQSKLRPAVVLTARHQLRTAVIVAVLDASVLALLDDFDALSRSRGC
jgi:hypothetical protein